MNEELEAIRLNAKDFILVLINVIIEIVDAVSANENETEQRLTDIANKLDGFARKLPTGTNKLLLQALANNLIATERTT